MSENITLHVGNGPSLDAILLENFLGTHVPTCLASVDLTEWGMDEQLVHGKAPLAGEECL